MPIAEHHRARYPANWAEIRAEVHARAHGRCEGTPDAPGCGVPDLAVGQWIGDQFRPPPCDAWAYPNSYSEALIAAVHLNIRRGPGEPRYIVIVLTTAHLNHVPEDNGWPGHRPNLRLMCQRHHLQWDRSHHALTARTTRRARLAMADLFEAHGALP